MSIGKFRLNLKLSLGSLNALLLKRNIFSLQDEFGTHDCEKISAISHYIKKEIESKRHRQLNRPIRVGILCPNNYTYLASIFAVWSCRGTAITLNRSHPSKLVDFYLNDSECDILIKDKSESYRSPRDIPEIKLDQNRLHLEAKSGHGLRKFFNFEENSDDAALIVYTSGTSSRPKGVVLTHANLSASIESLNHCWQLQSRDNVLNSMPLNHVHGLFYCLLAPLARGARCTLLPKFDAKTVWEQLFGGEVNIFSGVPTMYYQLLEQAGTKDLKKALGHFKLFASASAPLSPNLSDRWFHLTGFRLIDRYGLSETAGLVLGNTIDSNKPGTVGRPSKTFQIRLVSSTGQVLLESTFDRDKFSGDSNLIGELEVKGPGVFKHYLNRPELSREVFTSDGWLKTGDTVEYLVEKSSFRLVGRTSVDVIKSGGVKLSALEIESRILENEKVMDAVVIGLPDEKWGQVVAAVMVVLEGFQESDFLKWCKDNLSRPSVPKVIKLVKQIERNQMGKVDKKSLILKFSRM